MSVTINGTSGITFPNATVQTTSGVTIPGGGAITGNTTFQKLFTNGGPGNISRIRTFHHRWSAGAGGGSINLIGNASSYGDIWCVVHLISYHSGRSYQMWEGNWGGYGNYMTSIGGGGGFGLNINGNGAGYGILNISWGALTVTGDTSVGIILYGNQAVTVYNGTLSAGQRGTIT